MHFTEQNIYYMNSRNYTQMLVAQISIHVISSRCNKCVVTLQPLDVELDSPVLFIRMKVCG